MNPKENYHLTEGKASVVDDFHAFFVLFLFLFFVWIKVFVFVLGFFHAYLIDFTHMVYSIEM